MLCLCGPSFYFLFLPSYIYKKICGPGGVRGSSKVAGDKKIEAEKWQLQWGLEVSLCSHALYPLFLIRTY